ncbi:MAG: hypothetical protein RLZ86_1031 [Actinomycetota bacterium]|jgi:short-subunit dehydrogenase
MLTSGRHVVVTGASRGIGAEIARSFARAGSRVTVIARGAEPLEAIAAEIGGRAVVADLFDTEALEDLVRRIEAGFGPVDVLVNNAGMETTTSIFDTTTSDVDDLITLNLRVPIHLTRLVLPGMRDRNLGHVVNISSMAANGGFGGMSVYSASKAGLSHFTRIVRQDLKGTAVRVTNLEVGPVPTELLANLTYPPAARSFDRFRRLRLMPNVPAERVGREAVRAVEREKRAVWLPRRAFLFGLLTGAPQRIAEPLIRDIR